MDMHYTIWPERRWVHNDTLCGWFSDALANDEIAEEYKDAKTISEIKAALSDAGLVTFGRPR